MVSFETGKRVIMPAAHKKPRAEAPFHEATRLPLDLALLIGDRTRELIGIFLAAIKPPSTEPIHKWAERNVELSAATSDIPGRISYDLFPCTKFLFEHMQNVRTRRTTLMAGAQSAKTEAAITLLMWRITENPTPAMWAMAVADQCEDFAKDRLFPAIQNCRPAFAHAPTDRRHWTKRMVKFDTMTLHLRGSNSKAKLQSSPIGLIVCDERREWKKGSINTIRKRMTTFAESQELSMGVAGRKEDELHNDWEEGSQTFIYFRCLKCAHSQPWRFGRDASVLFPEPRARGGIVWPTDETAKPKGQWDYDAVEADARYECEACGHLHTSQDKGAMIRTAHEFHRNPKALPAHYSPQYGLLIMPWESASFGKIARRFLEAKSALKRGDMERLITFVTEDLGEPWEPPLLYRQKGDLLARMGKYKMGQMWMDPKDPARIEPDTTLILTFDRQMMYLRYVIRQWRRNGQSRLIWTGKEASLDDLRALQLRLHILNQCVWGDDRGGQASVFRQKCLQWGWTPMFGEDNDAFTIYRREDGVDKSYRQGYRKTDLDPGIGTVREGRATIAAYQWSNPWYKDKLYFLFIKGLGPLWEIPDDIPADYLEELNGNEWNSDKNQFDEKRADHAADCELEQATVADIGGITRYLQRPTEEKKAA